MKKKLNTDEYATGLEGSLYFKQPTSKQAPGLPTMSQEVPQLPKVETDTPEGEKPVRQASIDDNTEQLNKQTTKQLNNLTTFERVKKHYAVDVYEDQIRSLKKIVLTRGDLVEERVTLQKLIMEALDKFITEQLNNLTT